MHEPTELRGLCEAGTGRRHRAWGHLFLLVLPLMLAGCATGAGWKSGKPARQFDFAKDTFAYPNELVWEYRYDENGKWTTHRRETRPSYYQHCFVVSRSTCQFFENAVFDPALPKADERTYRELIRKLIRTDPRKRLPDKDKIVFPGFACLREFSKAYEGLLKGQCGGAWRCYVQRGNWRIVFPFSRPEQQRMAERITQELDSKGVSVVHLVRFPQLTINHAVLIFGARSSDQKIEFRTYDPNTPAAPVMITFDRASRTFSLPPNSYFPGGRVDVYPIYDRLLY